MSNILFYLTAFFIVSGIYFSIHFAYYAATFKGFYEDRTGNEFKMRHDQFSLPEEEEATLLSGCQDNKETIYYYKQARYYNKAGMVALIGTFFFGLLTILSMALK